MDHTHRRQVRNRMADDARKHIKLLESELEHYAEYFTDDEVLAIRTAVHSFRELLAMMGEQDD